MYNNIILRATIKYSSFIDFSLALLMYLCTPHVDFRSFGKLLMCSREMVSLINFMFLRIIINAAFQLLAIFIFYYFWRTISEVFNSFLFYIDILIVVEQQPWYWFFHVNAYVIILKTYDQLQLRIILLCIICWRISIYFPQIFYQNIWNIWNYFSVIIIDFFGRTLD